MQYQHNLLLCSTPGTSLGVQEKHMVSVREASAWLRAFILKTDDEPKVDVLFIFRVDDRVE